MSGRWCRRLLPALLALGVLLAATGCDVEDRKLLREFFDEWIESKNLKPTNKDKSINIGALLNLGSMLVTGSTGDAESDAILEAGLLIKNLQEADELMEKGRKNRDPKAMDEAIAKQPGDWSYRLSRASLALVAGDLQTYTAQEQEAVRRWGNISDRGRRQYLDQQIGELEDARRRIDGNFRTGQQCQMLYGELAAAYAVRVDNFGGSSADRANYETYRQQAERCPR